MENTSNYLLILEESLGKKIVILDELSRLTSEQKEIVNAETFDDDAFDNNIEKKAALVNELGKLDNGFELLYKDVKGQLETERDRYADEIKRLQTLIKEIMDKSASLQVMEQRNNEFIKNKFNSLKKEARQIKKSREMAANYYKTMNNISSEPYFLDKKK